MFFRTQTHCCTVLLLLLTVGIGGSACFVSSERLASHALHSSHTDETYVELIGDCSIPNTTERHASAQLSNKLILLENTEAVLTYLSPRDSKRLSRYLLHDKLDGKNLSIGLLYGVGNVDEVDRFTYMVDCGDATNYPPGMTCNMFREFVRYTISYLFSWINVYNDRRGTGRELPRIRLVEALSESDPNYAKHNTLLIRMEALSAGRLGVANYELLRINYKEKWYYDDLDEYHKPLLKLAGESFQKMLDIYRPRMFPGQQSQCAYSFVTTLMHELFHSLRLEHATQYGILMAPFSLSRRHGLIGNSKFGFGVSSNELMALRTRWNRNNDNHPTDIIDDVRQEFRLTMRDTERFANYEELSTPEPTTTPKPTTRAPITTTGRETVIIQPPIINKNRPIAPPPPIIPQPIAQPPGNVRVLTEKDQFLFGRTFGKLQDLLDFARKYF